MGGHVAAQLFQRLAILFGQKIRPHGQNLPELDEGRPQLLDDGAELFRGHAPGDVVAAHDLHDFHQPLAVFAAAFIARRHTLRTTSVYESVEQQNRKPFAVFARCDRMTYIPLLRFSQALVYLFREDTENLFFYFIITE